MHQQKLQIRRLNSPDEDGLIRVAVHARNEAVAALVEVYTTPNALGAFADALKTFPARIPSSYSFSASSGDSEITIDIETVGSAGHVSIHIEVKCSAGKHIDTATLWIRSQPWALAVFGQHLRHVVDLSTVEAELPE